MEEGEAAREGQMGERRQELGSTGIEGKKKA